jgi:NADPH:quinone reductase-like Zn-dependent oxidoreductase
MTQDAFGGPEVLYLTERAVPMARPGEICVRILAAGVNPVDCSTRAGRGMASVLGEPPFVLGWDIVGVVSEIGFGVTRFALGDRVFGTPCFPYQAGGYAEYIAAPARNFAVVPSSLGDAQAAALPLAALTAWQILSLADLQPDQRVLIHAAAGGVGHLAVQIAKARGAYVIGTASEDKHSLLAELGIDEAIDYQRERFERRLCGLDLVVDLVGGDYSLRSLKTLAPSGLLVSAASRPPNGLLDAAQELRVRATGFLVEPDRTALEEIARLVERDQLRVRVSHTLDLAEAARAHTLVESRRTMGKIVLQVG